MVASYRHRAVLVSVISLVGFALTSSSALMMRVPARAGSLGDLTYNVYPRIFTPNGDGANDKAAFHFTNPEDLPVEGEVFDLSGAEVTNLRPGTDPAALLLWDGKDKNGRVVPAGIYLYRI